MKGAKGALAVFVLALALLGIRALDPPTNPLDEFLPLVAAQRILAGEVPYRDFTTLYPPLTSLLDAALIAAFPRSVLLARLVFAALVALGLVLVRSIAAKLTGSERTGTLVALLALLVQGAPPWGYAPVLACVLVLGALACALRATRRATIAAGALLGLASLARHDAALWAAFPIGVVAGARSRRELGVLLGTAAVFPLGFLVFLVATGALGDAFHQLVVIPATLYPRIRGLPFPLPWRGPGDAELMPSLGSIYGPFLVSGLALAFEWRGKRRREALAAAALPFALGLSALVRPDHAHVWSAGLASFVALALLADEGWKPLGVALALTLPLALVSSIETARVARHVFPKKSWFCTRPPRTGLLEHGGIDNRRAAALDRIASRPAGSRIFVALPRHDRIWINDVSFYFDSGLLPATRHHELYALVATTEEVQEEIVRDLERWKPHYVVIATVRMAHEPNASAETFPVHVLDEYIASHYAVDLDETRYQVLVRKP